MIWDKELKYKGYSETDQNNKLFSVVLSLDNLKINHIQKSGYDIIDLLGDLGGVLEIFIFVFGVFMYPVSRHSYVLEMISRLFMAKTNDSRNV